MEILVKAGDGGPLSPYFQANTVDHCDRGRENVETLLSGNTLL